MSRTRKSSTKVDFSVDGDELFNTTNRQGFQPEKLDESKSHMENLISPESVSALNMQKFSDASSSSGVATASDGKPKAKQSQKKYDPKRVLTAYDIPDTLNLDDTVKAKMSQPSVFKELSVVSPQIMYHCGPLGVTTPNGKTVMTVAEQFLAKFCYTYYADLPEARCPKNCMIVVGYHLLKVRNNIDCDAPQEITDAYETLADQDFIPLVDLASRIFFDEKKLKEEQTVGQVTDEQCGKFMRDQKNGPVPEVLVAVKIIDVALTGQLWLLKTSPLILSEYPAMSAYINEFARGRKCLLEADFTVQKCVVAAEIIAKNQELPQPEGYESDTDGGKAGENDVVITDGNENIGGRSGEEAKTEEKKNAIPATAGLGALDGMFGASAGATGTPLSFSFSADVPKAVSSPRKRENVFARRGFLNKEKKTGTELPLIEPPNVSELNTRPPENLLEIADAPKGEGRNTTAFRENALDLDSMNLAITEISMTQSELAESFTAVQGKIDSIEEKTDGIEEVRENLDILSTVVADFIEETNKTLGLILGALNTRDLAARTDINRALMEGGKNILKTQGDHPSSEVPANPAHGRQLEKVTNKRMDIISRLEDLAPNENLPNFVSELKEFCKDTTAASMTARLTVSRLENASIRMGLVERLKKME